MKFHCSIPVAMLLCWLGAVSARAGDIPTYRGFPVYPPERAEQLLKDNPASVSVPLRSREQSLEKFKKMKVEKESDLNQLNGEFFQKVSQEFGEAAKYLHEKADQTGWHQIHEDRFLDGGSPSWMFAKVDGGKLKTVRVCLWSGMVTTGFHIGVTVDKDWGTVSYQFEEQPAPPLEQGFPMVPGVDNLAAYERKKTAEGTVLQIRRVGREGASDIYFYGLPKAYGWTQKVSPELPSGKMLWQREGRLVLADWNAVNSNRVFTFFTTDQNSSVLEKYRETAAESARIDSGCLVVDGRYLRPPYSVELKDMKLTVNGVVLEAFDDAAERRAAAGGFGARSVQAFGMLVESLRAGGVEIRFGRGSKIGTRNISKKDIAEFLSSVDSVVKGTDPRDVKLKKLAEIRLLEHSGDANLSLFLEHWDGF